VNILFLSNNPITDDLLFWLEKDAEEDVTVESERLTKDSFLRHNPELVISYNYQYIIKKDILDLLPNGFVNLHIGYLPWNKGVQPNIWSFLENTPKGITIHIIDEGVDTGNLLLQKRIEFPDMSITLLESYTHLHSEMRKLFQENWDDIKNKRITPYEQKGEGTFHLRKELNGIVGIILPKGWDTPVSELKRLYDLSERQ